MSPSTAAHLAIQYSSMVNHFPGSDQKQEEFVRLKFIIHSCLQEMFEYGLDW